MLKCMRPQLVEEPFRFSLRVPGSVTCPYHNIVNTLANAFVSSDIPSIRRNSLELRAVVADLVSDRLRKISSIPD